VRPLTVNVNRPELVDDLVRALRQSGCRVRRTGEWSCAVEHLDAVDEHEARVEVTFFLRAWQAHHACAQAAVAPA
jgi:hypothetical protein